MARPLEQRRLAVVAALRAVMAEPSARVVVPVESVRAPEPTVETVTFDRAPMRDVARRPSLRQALTAAIDWDEPEPVDPFDDLAHTPDDLSELQDLADDWITPSVPPLETAGSMSRAASMALFGHA